MNEKYIPLYRKYRPQTLEEIVGQEHIKKALTNAVNLNKITHAYLFTGPRGTGKTSTARILAKSLNCKNGPTVNPCGTCESCEAITNSVPIDVIEIDAASNRSVEDAQNILEKIQYVPVNGKYKIYIIDEVHMLTNTAFNALLKTLEEPPENVIFILATTEVHKVLDTIKSRCQRFDFKRITTEDIVKHLKHIAEIEKINISQDALVTIAKNSAGGMRDSIALLDQLSVLDSTKEISVEDINSVLGRLSFDILNNLVDSIITSNPETALQTLENIYNSGNEPSLILSNLLNYLKNLLIVKTCKSENLVELTQLNELQISSLQKQVKDLEIHQIVSLINKTSEYIKEIKFTTTPQLWLEVAIIDLANLAENTKLADLQRRIVALEDCEDRGVSTKVNIRPNIKSQPEVQLKPQVENNQEKESEKSVERIEEKPLEPVETEVQKLEPQQTQEKLRDLWLNLLKNIESPSTAALLNQQGFPIEISESQVVIGFKKDLFLKQINTEPKKLLIQEAAKKIFGKSGISVVTTISNNIEDKKKIEPLVEQKTEKVVIPDEESKLEDKKDVENKKTLELSELTSEQTKDETEDDIVENLDITAINRSDLAKMTQNLFDGKYLN